MQVIKVRRDRAHPWSTEEIKATLKLTFDIFQSNFPRSISECDSLGLWDHDGLQQLIQLVLDKVWQLAHSALVHLDHVQVQLELFGDGWVVGLIELCVLTCLARRTERR